MGCLGWKELASHLWELDLIELRKTYMCVCVCIVLYSNAVHVKPEIVGVCWSCHEPAGYIHVSGTAYNLVYT